MHRTDDDQKETQCICKGDYERLYLYTYNPCKSCSLCCFDGCAACGDVECGSERWNENINSDEWYSGHFVQLEIRKKVKLNAR